MKIKSLRQNPQNPRKITDAKLRQLDKSMQEFGDLSGIVFNRASGNLIGGNQRSKNLDSTSKVVTTKKFEKPTKTGTVAVGYVLHQGERFSYREVEWDAPRETAAMIAANKNAGEWDTGILTDRLKFLSSFDVNFDLDLTMFDELELKPFAVTTVREHERALSGNADIDDEEPNEEPPEEPAKLEGPVQLFNADCIETLRGIKENTFDSVVTDPPYGWRFMGKSWDAFDIKEKSDSTGKGEHKKEDEWYTASDGRRRRVRGGLDTLNMSSGSYDLSVTGNQIFQKFSEEWAREVFRVLKPGGHVIIFCGPRTYHRMASGVEDAGFEIRDQLQWLFGSGFPKSLDISKAIDKSVGAEREVTGTTTKARKPGSNNSVVPTEGLGTEYKSWDDIPIPATAVAAAWEGWGTALKPSNEPILLARKPISEKTVAANVLKWGVGGINIEDCRIGFDAAAAAAAQASGMLQRQHKKEGATRIGPTNPGDVIEMYKPGGRFPANTVLDETAACLLDEQSGTTESGGASRFFYIAKASKSEKNMHCRELPAKFTATMGDGIGKREHNEAEPGAYNNNNHPTVKPVSLMRYLCRLVTPPNGLVLDPFLGSGTTGVAALRESFRFVGIEREKEYFKICKKRLNYSVTHTDMVKTKNTVLRKKDPATQGANRDGSSA